LREKIQALLSVKGAFSGFFARQKSGAKGGIGIDTNGKIFVYIDGSWSCR
jgi:hypothetical protein